MKEENINALDEIHKGACMGVDAIHFIREKVEDNVFRNLLDGYYNNYQDIALSIEKIYPNYNDDKPHETNAMNKAMTWYGINVKTINDKSNSKISELLLQGINMGIIEGKKILNNKNIDEEVQDIVNEYVRMQEKMVEKFKTFL